MSIEDLLAEYGAYMKSYGRAMGVGDRVLAIGYSGSAERRLDAIINALTEQAEVHSLELRAYEATVANLEAQVVPDGWQLVPVAPTPEMINAGRWSEYRDEGDIQLTAVSDDMVAAVYTTMLADSPQPNKGE